MLDTTEIDRKIKEAQARKTLQGQGETKMESVPQPRRRMTEEDKERFRLEREEAKTQKAQARAERKAAKESERPQKAAHMTKVEKARARLPELTSDLADRYQTLVSSGASLNDLENLAAHLSTYVRAERTRLAVEQTLVVGQGVKVVGGDPRYVGHVGTVEKVQRIRCYVNLPGVDKPVYLFTSDVIDAEQELGADTEQVEQDEAASA